MLPYLFQRLPFDHANAFRTVTVSAFSPVMIAVHRDAPWRDLASLIADGNLLVAHTGVWTVSRFNARAAPTLAIKSCAGASTTNLCLGGPDGRDLFITESGTGSILRARLESA